MMSFGEAILLLSVITIVGMVIGYLGRKDIQKTKCPYCSCRNCCGIGFGIDAACSEEELEPLACKKK